MVVGFEGEGDLELVGGEGQIHGGLWIGEAWGRAEGDLEEIGHSIQIGVGGGSLFGWREAAAADPATSPAVVITKVTRVDDPVASLDLTQDGDADMGQGADPFLITSAHRLIIYTILFNI